MVKKVHSKKGATDPATVTPPDDGSLALNLESLGEKVPDGNKKGARGKKVTNVSIWNILHTNKLIFSGVWSL
jgi:hypothetical protein